VGSPFPAASYKTSFLLWVSCDGLAIAVTGPVHLRPLPNWRAAEPKPPERESRYRWAMSPRFLVPSFRGDLAKLTCDAIFPAIMLALQE